MSLEERTRREVDRRLDRLREQYGDFPVAETTVTNDPEFYEEGRELAAAGWIGDAGAWVTDGDGRVLLIRHEAAPDRWGVPGGGHEPGERLAETARREVREETGVRCSITGVFRARRKTIVHENDSDRQFQMLSAWFEADYGGGETAIGDDEVVAARWFAERPDAVHGFLAEKVENRFD